MLPFPKCPVCSNQIVQKEVEEIVRGGNNTAVIKIQAEVCLRCGERLYTPETIALLEKVTHKLELQETAEFQLLGQTYLVTAA